MPRHNPVTADFGEFL